MILFPFKIIAKTFLGIDIGTSSIRVVELLKWGKRIKLENYGELQAQAFYKKSFRTFEETTLVISARDIAKAIRGILEEAKIKTKKVIFSIPDFSSFFTWFDLPPMTESEIPEAVRYEARRHTPLPLSEVTLDWQIIEGRVSEKESTKLKILLVAVPNEVINQYRQIAALARLELQAIEAEAFAFARSSARNEKQALALVDIGARTTTCSIIDKGVLKRSYSFDVSGSELTNLISKSLNVDYLQAEELKRKYGIYPSTVSQENLEKILFPLLDLVLAEIKKISQNFYRFESREVQKVILGGGSALLPGLKEYFSQSLKKEVVIANPFPNIFYPPILEKTLKEMGPSYAIAVGAALRGLE